MNKTKIRCFSSFILSLIIIATVCLPCSARNFHVNDNEGLLLQEQAEQLEKSLSHIYAEYGIIAAVATDGELDGKDVQSYADDLLDYHLSAESGIVFVVSDSQREYAFSTVGEAMNIFGGYQFDILEENILEYLADGGYYEAFEIFAALVGSMASDYRNGEYGGESYYEDDYYENGYQAIYEEEVYEEITYTDILIISLIAGVIIAFISVPVMKAQLKSVRSQNAARSYVKSGSMVLTKQNDRFLYRTVNKVRRQQNSSSGGAGVHRSSSGRSHGGRSGKF